MAYTKYLAKHIRFLEKNIAGRTYAELTELFNERFGMSVTVGSVGYHIFKHGLCTYRYHEYTPEEIRFLEKNVKGRKTPELTALFNKRFNLELAVGQIRAAINNRGLCNGIDSRFKKGSVPFNKGMKGYCSPGCEKGWFKPGHRSANWRPLESERVNIEGYVEVKVSNDAMPMQRRWKMKHVVIWEKVNGKVPKGHLVVFLDGNRFNMALDNLMMISRQVHGVMCHLDCYTGDKEVTKTNILMAAVKVAIANRKRKSFKDVENKKMVFIDNNGKQIVIVRITGKDKFVAARKTKSGFQILRAETIKPRKSLEEAQLDLYEYAYRRGWQRV